MKKYFHLKIYLFILFVLISNLNNAQNCEFKIKEQDKFTGESSLLTISEIMNEKGKNAFMELLFNNGSYFVTMNYTEKALKANGWSCTNDDPLIILFSDNSTLNLYPVEFLYKTEKTRMDQWGAAFIGSMSAFKDKFIFAPQYHISQKEFIELSEKNIKSIRITANGKNLNTLENTENIEFDVSIENAESIINDAKCILENINSENSSDSQKKDIQPYAKVMNPAFSDEFSKTDVTIEAELFSREGPKIWSYPSKIKKYVKFQCLEVGSDPTEFPFVGSMGNIFCIDKENSDILFNLNKGDKLIITGKTYTFRQSGSENVYFIVSSLDKE